MYAATTKDEGNAADGRFSAAAKGKRVEKIRDAGLIQDEPLIFEKGAKGRKGYSLPRWDTEEAEATNLIPPTS